MLNASVGLQRVFRRGQPTQRTTSFVAPRQDDVHSGSDSPRIRVATGQSIRSTSVGHRVTSARRFSLRRAIRSRVGPEALLPAVVVLIVLVATYASWAPGASSSGSTGGPDGNGPGPRLAVAGFAGAGAGGNDGSGPTAEGSAEADGSTAGGASLIGRASCRERVFITV